MLGACQARWFKLHARGREECKPSPGSLLRLGDSAAGYGTWGGAGILTLRAATKLAALIFVFRNTFGRNVLIVSCLKCGRAR